MKSGLFGSIRRAEQNLGKTSGLFLCSRSALSRNGGSKISNSGVITLGLIAVNFTDIALRWIDLQRQVVWE